MNKSELVAEIASDTGLSQSAVDSVISSMFGIVEDRVANKGDDITIPGYIKFERTYRKPRTGRNPQTGETIEVPGANAMKVSAGSKLKKAAKAST